MADSIQPTSMASNLDDLVAEFQSGNREAFATLVRRNQILVTSIAFANNGDLQRSEDIAQQAFLLAWQKREQLASPSRFVAWLRGITINLARNERRLKENVRQRSAVSLSPDLEPAVEEVAEQTASKEEQSRLLWATLGQIPIEYREPLILFYREDHSVAEVASKLELSIDAVKQRLKRGRAKIKTEVERLVEDILIETKPSSKFSTGVMLTLPVVSQVGTSALKTGVAMGGKTVGGKTATAIAASSFSLAGLLSFAGGLLFVMIGIGLGFAHTRSVAKKSTSDEERQLHWQAFTNVLVAVLAFACVLGTMLLYMNKFVGGWVLWGFVSPIFHWFQIHAWQKQLKLRRLYHIHGKPKHLKGVPDGRMFPAGPIENHRSGALGGLLGCWGWLLILLVVGCFEQVWLVPVLLIAIGIVAYFFRAIEAGPDGFASFASFQRYSAQLVWEMCLVVALFCAALFGLLLIVNEDLLLKAMHASAGFGSQPENNQRSTALYNMVLVCPFMIWIGALVRWVCLTKANIAEEEAEMLAMFSNEPTGKESAEN